MKWMGLDSDDDAVVLEGEDAKTIELTSHELNIIPGVADSSSNCAGIEASAATLGDLSAKSGAKPYECEECHKRFAQPNGLKGHRDRHHSTKPNYKCKICNKKFKTSQHRKMHSALKFECPFCSKKFTYSSSCKTHWKGDDKGRIGCKVRRSQLGLSEDSSVPKS